MTQATSFYWHDYETFGTDPRKDWPSQFAGIRTDEALNIVGEPLMIYCKPAADCLPQPEACLLTGISPLKMLKEGLIEKDFIARIHQEISQANTCSVGYNSIRFDDEVTRHALYRNFYDPYQREYMNGNSRWDIIDLVRMTYALRPEGIHWPVNEDGINSFKLELLSKANNIGHEAAHDALSDVHATINLARLIKEKQPRLFDFYFELRKKQKALELLQQAYHEPVIHVSSKYPIQQHCLALVMALAPEPRNGNGVVVCDLSKNLEQLLELDAETLRKFLYTRSDDLNEGEERPPIKTVHANKSPALAPVNTLRKEDRERLALDTAQIEKNQGFIQKNAQALRKKVTEILSENQFKDSSDPDLMLYSGGFFNPKDKQKMQTLIPMDATALAKAQENLNFEDARIAEMLFRYRARNFPDSLQTEEQQQWKNFCQAKLKGELESTSITISAYFEQLKVLKAQHASDKNRSQLLNELEEYGNRLLSQSVSGNQ